MAVDETRLRELKTAFRKKTADNQAIADSFKVEDGVVIVDAEQKSAFDRNMVEIKELKGLIDSMEALKEADEWGRVPEKDSVATETDAMSAKALYLPRAKSLGQAFIESSEFKALRGGQAGATMQAPFVVKTNSLGEYNVKDVYTALPSGTPGSFGTVERDPIVIPPQRKRRVRDLFPVRTTNSNVIEYFRMTGFTNNASVVPERISGPAFGDKPHSTFTFQGYQSAVRTIAHWEAAHRNVLADEPQLRSIIDNELLYGLRLQEDAQILSGTGTGEDLEGVLNTSGIQTYSWSSGVVGDNQADAVRRAATLAFLAYYEPTGVVMHPNDWEDIELTKNDQGTYLMAVSIQQGAEARIWRLPVIDTPAIAEGTVLVGAFGTGAQLYDRETASIRISEQHSDFFVRNAIVILAEQRLALAVKRPEAFVKVTLDSAPS